MSKTRTVKRGALKGRKVVLLTAWIPQDIAVEMERLIGDSDRSKFIRACLEEKVRGTAA
jgi:hypothetical protein